MRSYLWFACTVALGGLTACSQPDEQPSEDTGVDIADASVDTDANTDPVADSDAGPQCGDGIVDPPYEQCEPSVGINCTDIGFAYGVASCDDSCRADTSACSTVPICGDNAVDGSETCDDGNRTDGDGCNADCQTEGCGDGVVGGDEECDGNRTIACADSSLGVLTCSNTCELEGDSCGSGGICGDATVDSGEACDDGNTISGDGCSSACNAEACGDGVRQGQEACDGNDLGASTCASLGFDEGTLYCTDACRTDTERCVVAVCGDGVIQGDEFCDDGNRESDDGCSRSCAIERCGDGRASAGIGEQCDGIDIRGLTCADFGFALAPLTCRTDCRVDLSECEPLPRCGDGATDIALGETCDDGNTSDDDGCSAGCLIEGCGDGVVQSSEACEPGISPAQTCDDEGGFLGGRTRCADDCTVDLGACISPGCGNALLDDGEECDGILSTSACLDEGFDFGRLDCTDTCELDTGSCRWIAQCGDGTVSGTEECDDGNSLDGDGCSLDCLTESCGDGIVQPGIGEVCDGGSIASIGCGTGGTSLGVVSCTDTCAFDAERCFESVCGNGVIEVGEACDDGNRQSGDGCNFRCLSETCDDGTVQPYEACDGADIAGAACADIGVTAGSVTCTACALDYSICSDSAPICGNGVRERGEQCDAGDANADIADVCRTDCTLPTCGDGITDIDETCDDAGAVGGCPDTCIEDAFVVPDDGSLAAGLLSPFELILVRGPNDTGPVLIDGPVTIRGIGDDAELRGDIDSRVLEHQSGTLVIENVRIRSRNADFALISSGSLTIRDVDFEPFTTGGCLRHLGAAGFVEIYDSTFTGCTLIGSGPGQWRGGAIATSSGAVTIERTTVTDTSITNASQAYGAISLTPTPNNYVIEIEDVTISGTLISTERLDAVEFRGGGIDIEPSGAALSGVLNVTGLIVADCRIVGAANSGTTNGGGIGIRADGARNIFVTVADAVITGNELQATSGGISGGGGIYAYATNGAVVDLLLSDFEFSDNSVQTTVGQAKGGALYVAAQDSSSSAVFMAIRGLMADNSASAPLGTSYGGALELRSVGGSTANGTLQNVTITGNTTSDGGGIYLYSDAVDGAAVNLTTTHTTIAGNIATNLGGGLFSQGPNELVHAATIIVGNTAPGSSQCGHSGGSVVAASRDNVAPGGAGACMMPDPNHTEYDRIDALRALANNGSAIRTMLPAGGGPAIDAYSGPCQDALVTPIADDQRGLFRPVGDCDIGAAEVQAGE